HQANDAGAAEDVRDAKAAERIERLTREATKIRQWLADHPQDRPGSRGKVRKSNRTDNASAKLATDKGVIQGYCGVAVVDARHQIIVEASAHGTGAEQELLLPVLDACAEQRTASTLITADAGYHSEANLAALADQGIDALIADHAMRRRDERFAGQDKHLAKPDPLHDKSRTPGKPRLFGSKDFITAPDQSHVICPAGKRLHRNGKDCTIGGYAAIKFRAPDGACKDCPLRAKCLRKPETTRSRQVAVLTRKAEPTHSQRMRERIDSAWGREQYGRRFATVEPVFGNVRANKRLNRFTLRGQAKVDGQWKLFALVHNIEKWANYRKAA
ncbi:IS4 family transposase, partial [Rhodanobacter denitrificans]